jgi:site-specific DNA recombinase
MKSSSSPRTAAIYARQSLSHTEGIDRQIALCRKLCKERGWEVVEIFEDNDVSASKARGSKTAWGRMLAAFPSGGFDVVVAVDLDRLLRKVSDLSILTDAGIRVLTVNGEIDLTTADGQFRATMLASIAQFETKRKSERQLRANEARATSGRPVPTRRRYGYETDGCTPRPSEAEEVKRLFEKFKSGESIRSLALDLQRRGVDPGGGKGWRVGRVRDILGNCAYGGQTTHHGVVYDSKFVTPIVPKALASDVRAILADPSRRTSPGASIKHELSGIAECGVCGGNLKFMVDYTCSKASNHVSIRKYKLEPEVMWKVMDWISSDYQVSYPKAPSKNLEKLLTESANLAQKIITLQEMAEWEGADLASLKSRIRELGRERSDLEARIAEEKSSNAIGEIVYRVRAEWQKPVNQDAYEAWKLAMEESSKLMGWSSDPSLLSVEAFELKTRIERQIDLWPSFWKGLTLDTRREVIRSLFRIKVHKGSSLDRVEITSIDKPT